MMKLVILCALIALAAARLEDYEHISVGPAIVDFDPEATSSINLENIRELLLRLLEFIKNLRPNAGQRPLNKVDLNALWERIIALVQKLFPNGVPRPPRPSGDAVEDLSLWIESLFNHIISSYPSSVARPLPGLLEAIRDWWSNIGPLERPVNLENLKDWLRRAIASFPRPVEEPVPVEIPEPAIPVSSPLVQIVVNVGDAASVAPTPIHFVDDAE